MALARVQATGRVSAAGTTSVSLTFATPPTVGNGIVVVLARYDPSGATVSCADNRGNTYAVATTRVVNPMGAAILYCPAITASAAPFTLTLTNGGNAAYWEAAAVEVGGGGTGLAIDQVVSQGGTSATPSPGVTVALTGSEVFIAAVHAIGANQTSLVVQTVSPAWTEEFENLSYSTTIAGEGDTRIITGAAGTTQTCGWTGSASSTWAAALAAFKAGAAVSTTGVNLSQLPVEVLRGSQPAPALRLSQLPVEILRGSQPLPALYLSQLPIEILRSPGTAENTTLVNLSQLPVEVLLRPPPVVSACQVTQLVVETVRPVAHAPLAATQVAAEVLFATVNDARVTALACELIVVPAARQPRLIRRLRRAPHVHADHRRIAYARFALDLQRGVGGPPGLPGANPQVTLRVSRDGGRTWSEPVAMPAGRLGAYTTRVLARRLGQARDAVFEVTVSDPVAWSLVQAWLELEPGNS